MQLPESRDECPGVAVRGDLSRQHGNNADGERRLPYFPVLPLGSVIFHSVSRLTASITWRVQAFMVGAMTNRREILSRAGRVKAAAEAITGPLPRWTARACSTQAVRPRQGIASTRKNAQPRAIEHVSRRLSPEPGADTIRNQATGDAARSIRGRELPVSTNPPVLFH